jgi:hypothetical protein
MDLRLLGTASLRPVVALSLAGLALACLSLAGCSSSGKPTLRDSSDLSSFVSDAARESHVRWQLSPQASSAAKHAWRNKRSFEEVGYELRHGEAWWGCGLLSTLSRHFEEHQVALKAEDAGAAVITVNEVIGKADLMTPAEMDDVVAAVCKSA